MPRMPSNEKAVSNRSRIIEAANILFYHRGYNQTSFHEIADATGIPKGNFYYYFRSKDDLLKAVIEDRIAHIRAMLTEWDAQLADPRARLVHFVQMLVGNCDELVRYGCPLGSLNAELGKTQPALKSQAAKLFDVLVEWLTRQIEDLGFKEARARALALALTARAQGITLISNVYENDDFLREEAAALQGWIASLTPATGNVSNTGKE
jgi:AcrR family transcriptional regulator